jgi:nucleotide-binding universal stress UspA family protein
MRIIIATDGTKQGEAAVAILSNFKLTAADEITIVSVVDMAVPLAIDVYGVYLPETTELEKASRDNANCVLDAAVNAAKVIVAETEISISGEVLFGSPESRIVETAEKMSADLIIVGSHGYNRWERLLLGSVSDSVVHHAPCSVLIVRTQEAKA